MSDTVIFVVWLIWLFFIVQLVLGKDKGERR